MFKVVYSLPTYHYFFLASRFGVGYPFVLAVTLPMVYLYCSPKGSPMSRDKTLKVRVSNYEYEQLKLESKKQGVSMSDVVRKYISRLGNQEILTVVETT
jgi:hypothetical protein